MKTIRCSSLPRLMSCTASGQEPDIRIDSDNEIARVGNAAHEAYALMVDGKDVDISAIALKHNVDEKEVTRLYWQGKNYWDELKDGLAFLQVEREMRRRLCIGMRLSGHPDVFALREGDYQHAVIIDWKTGYKETDPRAQCLGYAILALNKVDQYERVSIVLCWTRLGIKDVYSFGIAEVMEFKQQLIDAVNAPTLHQVYVPSESNCMYCPRSRECPAKRELLSSAYEDMTSLVSMKNDIAFSPEGMAALHPKTRMLKKALDEYDRQLKVMLESGDIVADGKRYSLEDASRKTILFDRKTLSEHLPSNVVDDLQVTITGKDLDAAIMSVSERGKGAGNKRDVMEALVAAESVIDSPHKKIKITKDVKEASDG